MKKREGRGTEGRLGVISFLGGWNKTSSLLQGAAEQTVQEITELMSSWTKCRWTLFGNKTCNTISRFSSGDFLVAIGPEVTDVRYWLEKCHGALRQLFKVMAATDFYSVRAKEDMMSFNTTRRPREIFKHYSLVHVQRQTLHSYLAFSLTSSALSELYKRWVTATVAAAPTLVPCHSSRHRAHGALGAAGVTGAVAGLHDGVSAVRLRWVQFQVRVLKAVL